MANVSARLNRIGNLYSKAIAEEKAAKREVRFAEAEKKFGIDLSQYKWLDQKEKAIAEAEELARS